MTTDNSGKSGCGALIGLVILGFIGWGLWNVLIVDNMPKSDQTRIDDAQQSVKDNAKFNVSFCGNDTVEQHGDNYVVTGCVQDDSEQQGQYIVNMDVDDNINGGTITGLSQ